MDAWCNSSGMRRLTVRVLLFGYRPGVPPLLTVLPLARYYHRSPDRISDDELKDYQFHLHQRKLRSSSIHQAVHALRTFYTLVLHRPVDQLQRVLIAPRPETRRPEVFSIQEIEQLLTRGAPEVRDRTFLATVHTAGLRLTEARHLRIQDLLTDRLQIRVEQGKGRKD